MSTVDNSDSLSNNPRINKLLGNVLAELRGFTEEQARHISELAAIGKAMSAEKDINVILEMILSKARDFTNADGGTLYLLTDERDALVFNVMHNDTLNSYMGGTSGNPVTVPNVPLYNEAGDANHANVSAHVAHSGNVINIPDVYFAEGFNFEGAKKFDAALNYRSMSMLVVPMTDHENEIIGVLQLINAKDLTSGDTIPFSPDIVDITIALASQAAVVLTQQKLISDLKELFDSFIKAIATAIDRKSKYTGGHIERVATLTMMLAKRVNDVDFGPLKDITLNEDQLEELRIAAWLHDTGKITTPEYVVDKANKLETIYDRVDLLKTRWQTIKLQRQLDAERQKVALFQANGNESKLREIDAQCQEDLAKLDEDLEFLVNTNTGGEFMADDKIERLENIARNNYQVDGDDREFLSENEVYNLSIRKGTLTSEEREIINNHVVMTMEILDELPWPSKMKNVSPIAGAHHEKLDGTGYPLKLKGEEISLQARIMAVADIFEALSARDRPYKKPMVLSQAVKILGFMVKDQHIDKDVVDMFIDTGLIQEYADVFLAKDQIDVKYEPKTKEELEEREKEAVKADTAK